MQIFISAHTPFECPVKNPIYKIIKQNDFKMDTDLETFLVKPDGVEEFYNMPRCCSELLNMFYIAKNVPLDDKVGFVHYRAYFGFMDDVPDIPKGETLYHCWRNCSSFSEYPRFHFFSDIALVQSIIFRKWPQYEKALYEYDSERIFHSRNMFITDKEVFLKATEHVMAVCSEYIKIRGLKTDEDVRNMVEPKLCMLLDKISPLNTVDYQQRVIGFLGERLYGFFITLFSDKVTNTQDITIGDRL